MTLHLLTPPQESQTALSAALYAPVAGRAVGLRALAATSPPKQAKLPHPVYVLGLDKFVGTCRAADAKLVCWRYLVGDSDTHEFAAEIGVDTEKNHHSFSSFNEGPFVGDTAEQLGVAQRDPRVAAGDYELRMLRIPALYLMALWLKDNRSDDDLFIPVGVVQPPLKPSTLYS